MIAYTLYTLNTYAHLCRKTHAHTHIYSRKEGCSTHTYTQRKKDAPIQRGLKSEKSSSQKFFPQVSYCTVIVYGALIREDTVVFYLFQKEAGSFPRLYKRLAIN